MNAHSFLPKFVACFLAGALGAYALAEVSRKMVGHWLVALNAGCAVLFGSAVLFACYWQYTQQKQSLKLNTPKIFLFWQGAIRYFIALDLAMFAWRKIFVLQFYAPHALLDKPVSALTGAQLTIAYFAYSYPFGVCLAGLQLAGASLLLCNATRLLGVFVLMPVITTIILLDAFYQIETGALLMALFLLAGLVYCLGLDYEKVKVFFFSTEARVSARPLPSRLLKSLARASALVIPLAVCVVLYDFPHRHPDITGKFTVTKLMINDKPVGVATCTDSVLTTVYLDDNNDIVFERNSPKHWQVGHFTYDKTRRHLAVTWRYPKNYHDTLSATLTALGPANTLALSGVLGRDKLRVELRKIK